MPLFDRSLSSHLSTTTLPPSQICLILFQILSGIHHINKNGLVHRDIKTENVLIREMPCGTLHAVITDFGMCHQGMTVTGSWPHGRSWGNPLIPPEIGTTFEGGGTCDYSKSDVWSVGTMIYEMLGEKCPFSPGGLSPKTYTLSDLPQIPHYQLSELTRSLLSRDPLERPSAHDAAVKAGSMRWLGENHSETAVNVWNLVMDRTFEAVLLTQFLDMAGVIGNTGERTVLGSIS